MMQIHVIDLDFLDLSEAIAVFVIEGPEGLALVETGPYASFPHLEKALALKGWKTSDFKQVMLSHIHFDHAGAAWAFAQTGAKIYVHPRGLPHLASPERLYQSARMIYGDDMDRLWGAMHDIPPAQLHAPEHGETITAAGLEFRAWHTPGHAIHHIAWELVAPDGQSAVFTGDVAGVRIGNGPVMPPCPPPDIHVEDWQQSIALLRQLSTTDLYLTHFGKVSDKLTHLDQLEQHLLEWAAWIKPYSDAGIAATDIIPDFQAFVQGQLLTAGADEALLERYEAANPAFMSVAGLLRYWKKKTQS
ncbi:MAG: MBL fold metallo-hydrolase [Lewinellaceae bacterium]|nr:MBL fold metallo-hydrolase [Lewinellaceae bacterium]